MRDILFKGKRIDTGEWIEGAPLNGDDEYRIATSFLSTIVEDNEAIMVASYKVDPETICQYTGLTDKNGRKIFEGDILDAIDYKVRKGVVKFGLYKQPDMSNDYECGNQGFYVWFEESGQLRPDIYYWHGSSNVIGNIFDNPALLKGGDGT